LVVLRLGDRGRRWQDALVQRASFPLAVGIAVAALWFLQVFARIEQQVPFVYFQF